MSGRNLILGLALAGAAGVAGCESALPAGAPGAPPPPGPNAPSSNSASGPAPKVDAAITNALVDTLERKDRVGVDLTQIEGTPLDDLVRLGSPIGYNLRNRFLNVGVPLAEALARNADPVFREKLVTLARWDRNGETRAAALVAVARTQDPKDLFIFREALVHLDPAVRFGSLEALQVWGNTNTAIPLLGAVSEKDTEPILRVYASAGIVRLGDGSGLHRLRGFLDHPSWVVRAMAARYIGDFGNAEDYDLLVSRIGRELNNDFVVAELCISALKLFPKRPVPASAAPVQAPPTPLPPPESMAMLQLEPLVITAPRSRIRSYGIDPQVNLQLLRLLRERQDARPSATAAEDASVINLGKLSTLTGYNLKTRYTELGFLLTEGLAGVSDFSVTSELEKTVRLGSNAQTRAAAMVALAFNRDNRFLGLFQSAFGDTSVTVRFGALEALLVLADPAVQFIVANAARNDLSRALQLYAAAGLWRMGDIYGREILLRNYQDNDWFIRALSIYYLGEMGGADEYRRLMLQLSNETHPAVKAELCSALLRLHKFANQ